MTLMGAVMIGCVTSFVLQQLTVYLFSIYKRKRHKKYQEEALSDPFDDNQHFHNVDSQEFRVIYVMDVYAADVENRRLTLLFSRPPTIDDVFRQINKKYPQSAELDLFRLVIWNLGLPDAPEALYETCTVYRSGNSVSLQMTIETEN